MKKIKSYIFICIVWFLSNFSFGQQDAQLTQYMYQTQMFNPAYVGTNGFMSITGLHRTQWVGFSGAPKTYNLAAQAPINYGKMGVGVNFSNDQIGPTRNSQITGQWSYILNLNEDYKLSLGVSVQSRMFGIDRNLLRPEDLSDPTLNDLSSSNLFNFGGGAYLYKDNFYLGLSVPNFLQTKSWQNDTNAYALFKERMHFYLMSGYVIEINQNVKFKPALLSKIVTGAPMQLDVSTNFLLYEKFTVGAAYRLDSAFSGLVGFQISEHLLLGYAYDKETTTWGRFNDGSHEFFLRYAFKTKHHRTVSPRFF